MPLPFLTRTCHSLGVPDAPHRFLLLWIHHAAVVIEAPLRTCQVFIVRHGYISSVDCPSFLDHWWCCMDRKCFRSEAGLVAAWSRTNQAINPTENDISFRLACLSESSHSHTHTHLAGPHVRIIACFYLRVAVQCCEDALEATSPLSWSECHSGLSQAEIWFFPSSWIDQLHVASHNAKCWSIIGLQTSGSGKIKMFRRTESGALPVQVTKNLCHFQQTHFCVVDQHCSECRHVCDFFQKCWTPVTQTVECAFTGQQTNTSTPSIQNPESKTANSVNQGPNGLWSS